MIQDERPNASSAHVERIQQEAGSRVPESQAAEREPCAEEMWAPEGAKSVKQYMRDSLVPTQLLTLEAEHCANTQEL